MPHAGWLTRVRLMLLASVVTVVLLLPSAALAAGRLSWSAPEQIDPGYSSAPAMDAVSCPTVSLCVGVDINGKLIVSPDPTAGAIAWKATGPTLPKTVATSFHSISCASASLCVAAGFGPKLMLSTDPGGGRHAWRSLKLDDHNRDLIGISCRARSLCVAFDDKGDLVASTDPTGGARAWRAVRVSSPAAPVQGVSCASMSLCVAVDPDGVLDSSDPTGGARSWKPARVWTIPTTSSDERTLRSSVSCPSKHFCAAFITVAQSGQAAATTTALVTTSDPGGADPAWKTIEEPTGPDVLTALACPSTSLCVSGDLGGAVEASSDPGSATGWHTVAQDTNAGSGVSEITGVSCPSVSLCAASASVSQGDVLTSVRPGSAQTWRTIDVDQTVSSGGPTSISCPSASLCVAGDGFGNIISSTSPTDPSSTWTVTNITSVASCYTAASCGGATTAISCQSASLCLAGVGAGPDVLSSTQPTAGTNAWQTSSAYSFESAEDLEEGGATTGVACPTQTFCAVAYQENSDIPDGDDNVSDSSGVATSTDPTSASPRWQDGKTDRRKDEVTAISCATASVCIAVDNAGNAIGGRPGSWSIDDIDGRNALAGVSCPSVSLCVAVDSKGNVVTSKDPGAAKATWTTAHVDAGHALKAVSCPSASLCVAVDGAGNVVTSTDPRAGAGAWRVAADVDRGLTAVSCPSVSLCVAVDDAGDAVIGT
jgi:hypothetical protein